jgi:tRNA-dihydrouridine synthase B
MDPSQQFRNLLTGGAPLLALAPMQGVTDLRFLRLMAAYGGADVYFTEYFRAHATSHLEKQVLKSITENPTGQPIAAQIIGSDISALVRTARELQRYPVAAVDLNLGCPAPIVCRKEAGGALLRDPARVEALLGALRDALQIPFTVKTRIGYDSAEVFSHLLPIFARHSLDLLTVHARTVKEMYRSKVHYEFIARAVTALPCPVLANGNIYSAQKAAEVLKTTGARGLMIGRGAIRNPWLFRQIRDFAGVRPSPGAATRESSCAQAGSETSVLSNDAAPGDRCAPVFVPTGKDVLAYVRALYEAVCSPAVRDSAQVQKMKKYLNYLSVGVEPTGQFLHQVRRVTTTAALFRVCEAFLDHDRPMPLEPFPLALKDGDLMAGEQC